MVTPPSERPRSMKTRETSTRWDVELVEDWLVALDQSSYEQVVVALELLGERGPQLGRPSFGRHCCRFASQEHEGVAAGIERSFRVEGAIRLRS